MSLGNKCFTAMQWYILREQVSFIYHSSLISNSLSTGNIVRVLVNWLARTKIRMMTSEEKCWLPKECQYLSKNRKELSARGDMVVIYPPPRYSGPRAP